MTTQAPHYDIASFKKRYLLLDVIFRHIFLRICVLCNHQWNVYFIFKGSSQNIKIKCMCY